VVVIGAGLGGLAAALHLVGAGRRVTILEQADQPGGRAGRLSEGGYQFDTGPTVLTMPELIDEALGAVGERLADRLTLHRLDPAYLARFADGSQLRVHTDTDQMAEEIRQVCGPADAAGYLRLVDYLRELYRVELPHFIDRNLDSPLALLGPSMVRLLALGGLRRLGPRIEAFVHDDRLRRVFSFQALYAGLAPAKALAIYAVITYMDCVAGVYFPDGGVHAVPRALADAASRHGVDIRYGTRAASIEVSGDRARAVITADGERLPADAVVVNADLPEAYQRLLPPAYVPARVRRLRYSPSCVVLHAGLRHDPGARVEAHHTISFGQAWQATFEEVIDRGEPMSDPSFLVSAPTSTDPSLAPAGRETRYVLFPTPNLDHRHPIDWTVEGPRYQEQMIEVLAKRGFDGFADAETIHLRTPADWRAQGLAAGSPFAAAHTFAQTGPFRPATLDRRVHNLVFCGSSTQPGVGIPMVLISGKLAAQRIIGRPA
jgi:phytoene desaturase